VADADLAQLKQRLAVAEKKGKSEAVEAIRKLIADRERQAKDSAATDKTAEKPANDKSSNESATADLDVKAIICQAYLRSLSRYPTDAEADRASRYYEETGDVARGTRDLLWALVNTKEFVVNH
jgi:hypothetical protein